MGGLLQRIGYWFSFFLAVILAVNALSYFNFDPHYGFLRLKQTAIASGYYLPFYYSHVLVGGLILVAGLFQVHPASQKRFRKIHRLVGYFYVMGILFFAAPGGLVMSFFIGRGNAVLASFIVQSALWFWFTATAFDRIRHGDVQRHKEWMWRSYALTFAAITLRLYIFFTSSSFDLSQPTAYAWIAWLSWTLNLIAAEYIIFRSRKQMVAT